MYHRLPFFYNVNPRKESGKRTQQGLIKQNPQAYMYIYVLTTKTLTNQKKVFMPPKFVNANDMV